MTFGARTVGRSWIPLALLLGTACVGCRTASHTGTGAAIGTGAGALLGAVVGHQTGHAGAGALIGAAAGGITGAVAGDAADAREERDDAIRYARHVEEQREAGDRALTNYDLARLTAGGTSDEVIIAAIKSRGGRFNLSPDGLIELRSLGVNDRVVLAAQEAPESLPATRPPRVYRRPDVVVVPSVVIEPDPWHHDAYWHHGHGYWGYHH